jgi:hypothetical protein
VAGGDLEVTEEEMLQEALARYPHREAEYF